MTKTPDIADIICAYCNLDKSPEEAAAELGELLHEMEQEADAHDMNTQRMADLNKLIDLQKKVVIKLLEKEKEQPNPSHKPHLKLVKY